MTGRLDRLTAGCWKRNTPGPVWVALLLVVGAYLLHCRAFWAYINDDAFISFRYSKNLAMGRGLVYNPGEYVEGYTNFLHTLLIAGILKIRPDLPALSLLVYPKYLGVAAGLVVLFVSYTIARQVLAAGRDNGARSAYEALLAPALMAGNSAFAVNSVSGLETIPFAALVLLGIHSDVCELLGQRRRLGWLWYCLAVLSRPEGIAIFGLAALGRCVLGPPVVPWRRTARHVLPVALIFAAHLCFRFLYYDGELVPNTYWAKKGGIQWMTGMGYVWEYLLHHELAGLWLAGLIGIWALPEASRRPGLLLIIVGVGFLLTFAVLGGDWMIGSRLVMPAVAIIAGLTTIGIAGIMGWLTGGRHVWLLPVAGLLLLIADNIQEYYRRGPLVNMVTLRNRGYHRAHMAMTHWLRERGYLRSGDTIVLMDIGLVGYMNMDCRILDITGLTDRYIAKQPGRFLAKEYDMDYVLDERPRIIVVVMVELPVKDRQAAPQRWRLDYGTPIGERLIEAIRRTQHYRRVRTFEHDHPGLRYFLWVYVREDGRPPERETIDGARRYPIIRESQAQVRQHS